jgi:hypothetical protein
MGVTSMAGVHGGIISTTYMAICALIGSEATYLMTVSL